MSNQQISITVIDDKWPHLKIVVNRGGRVQTSVVVYDNAIPQFEIPVKDALRYAVEEIIKSHKGR